MFYVYILHGIAGIILLYIFLGTILRYQHSKKKTGTLIRELGKVNKILAAVLLAIPCGFIIFSIRKILENDPLLAIQSFYVAVFLGTYSYQSICKHGLGEHGILTPQGFITWKDIYSYRFDETAVYIRFFKLGNEKIAFQKKIKLTEEDIQILSKQLAKKVKKNR